jgi:DNA-binding transcriptional LysR family regulator
MDLRKLHHMVVLSEELNFARAAEKVHLTQSALSRSIQNLEQELGGKLFDRNLQSVALTPIGRQVVSRARTLLSQARNLQYEVSLLLQSELGNVKLGVGPLPATTFLPLILAELVREHPRVCVEVEVNNWEYLVQHLYDEEIEFFVAEVSNIAPNPRISIQPLARQLGGLFCHPSHPLTSKIIQHASEVLAYPLLTVRLPQRAKAGLKAYFELEEVQELGINLVCDNHAVLNYIAIHSDGVLMTTYAALHGELAAGRLVPVALPNMPAISAEMGIVTLTGRSLSPTAEWLVARMQRYEDHAAGQYAPNRVDL